MTAEAKRVWDGVYGSFSEAAGEAQVFEGSTWLDKNLAFATSALSRRSGGAIPPVAVTTQYALPFIAAAAARPGQTLRILDFGGGVAVGYIPLREMLPKTQPLEFIVVENPALCQRGGALFQGEEGVRFSSDLPVPPSQCDIVHFGSSIHYVDDWRSLLSAVTDLQPEYLLFADLTAADNCSFVTAQRYDGRRIPVHFWNVDEFIDAVCRLGFDLLLKARYSGYYLAPSAELPTDNFDAAHRLTYTSQLVFRRARATVTRRGE